MAAEYEGFTVCFVQRFSTHLVSNCSTWRPRSQWALHYHTTKLCATSNVKWNTQLSMTAATHCYEFSFVATQLHLVISCVTDCLRLQLKETNSERQLLDHAARLFRFLNIHCWSNACRTVAWVNDILDISSVCVMQGDYINS